MWCPSHSSRVHRLRTSADCRGLQTDQRSARRTRSSPRRTLALCWIVRLGPTMLSLWVIRALSPALDSTRGYWVRRFGIQLVIIVGLIAWVVLMEATEDAPDKEFACCAVGGDDATVSIWLAHLARPLAVIKDCFDASVTDLSWSSNESILLASSLDGTICCFKFDGGEIGRPISAAQQSKLLQSKVIDQPDLMRFVFV